MPASGSSTRAGWSRFRRGLAPRSGTAVGCRCCAVRRDWSSARAAPSSRRSPISGWCWCGTTATTPCPSHARRIRTPVEVGMLRAHQLRCAAMIGGYSRTAEAQAMVRTRWAHDLVAARPVVRSKAPRVIALDDSGYAHERDPAAHSSRLPSMALQAARSALDAGRPVLVQVPRRGYVPALACGRCRTIARCCQTLHRPAFAARSGCVGRGVPLVRPRGPRCAAPDAGPTPSAPSSSVRAAPPKNSVGPFRHHGRHLRGRRSGVDRAG